MYPLGVLLLLKLLAPSANSEELTSLLSLLNNGSPLPGAEPVCRADAEGEIWVAVRSNSLTSCACSLFFLQIPPPNVIIRPIEEPICCKFDIFLLKMFVLLAAIGVLFLNFITKLTAIITVKATVITVIATSIVGASGELHQWPALSLCPPSARTLGAKFKNLAFFQILELIQK